MSPNFRNFVTAANSTYVSGYWTVLGSALLYQQDAPSADMQFDVVMSPEKTGGQGFGMPGSAADDNT